MGIPHLTTLLRPYAESQILTGDVVIDGPGLAHHIFYHCLASKPGARNVFEAAPSYRELADFTLRWLDELQEGGACVRNIFFDGHLPSSKLTTRCERLQKYTQKVEAYHQRHRIPCRFPSSPQHDTASKGLLPGAAAALPALPFIVPALLDALRSSQYQTRTHVVPAEADVYCAQDVKDRGGIVLTGDSDLLVYDLGLEGAVSFFSDMEALRSDGGHAFSSKIYRSAVIAESLRLSGGLQTLAFAIVNEQHLSFPQLLDRARSTVDNTATQVEFKKFCAGYDLPHGLVLESDWPPFGRALRSLDPRISEFVTQFPSLYESSILNLVSPDVLNAFLPFLLDCPVRTSAWEMSTSVRQLAYGMINLIVPDSEKRYKVLERRRQQNGGGGRVWELPSTTEAEQTCIALCETIENVLRRFPKLSPFDLWVAVAVYQDVEWSFSLGKAPLSQIVSRQTTGHHNGFYTDSSWDEVHFLAQVQGSYYSFRMLKQICDLLMLRSESESVPKVASNLFRKLESLPELHSNATLFNLPTVIHSMRHNAMVEAAQKSLKLETPENEPVSSIIPSSKSGKKRKNRNGDKRAPKQTKQNASQNPFELLRSE